MPLIDVSRSCPTAKDLTTATEQTAIVETTGTPAPFPIRTRALDALGVGAVIGVLVVGGTIVVRHFFFEPQEQKAAFIQVSNSSDKELRAKSYDELISLRQNVDRFEDQPGMYMPASEQGRRLDRAIQTKNLLD